MAIRVLKIRRVMISIGASDEQADEFVEAMDDLVTKEDLIRSLSELEHRLMHRVIILGIALTGLNIAAMALLTQL